MKEFEQKLINFAEGSFYTKYQTFFDAIAIESRRDEKLQKQVLPLSYRTYMSKFLKKRW